MAILTANQLDVLERVLREVIASATADVAEYATKRGTPTWDDHRVGRMLARDKALAGVRSCDIAQLVAVYRAALALQGALRGPAPEGG